MGEVDFFNVALSGAMSKDLPQQVKELQKQSSRIDNFDVRWKVLTIFIGANDLCHNHNPCDADQKTRTEQVDKFETNLRSALSDIEKTFSRVYINLVSLFRLSGVYRLNKGHAYCETVHRTIGECKCLDQPKGTTKVTEQQLNWFDETNSAINTRIRSLAADFNLQRPDFAVVAQVASEMAEIPHHKFLSSLDCFHPSSVAHSAMAVNLWNGMFDRLRVHQPMDSNVKLFCPSADSVFFVDSNHSTLV